MGGRGMCYCDCSGGGGGINHNNNNLGCWVHTDIFCFCFSDSVRLDSPVRSSRVQSSHPPFVSLSNSIILWWFHENKTIHRFPFSFFFLIIIIVILFYNRLPPFVSCPHQKELGVRGCVRSQIVTCLQLASQSSDKTFPKKTVGTPSKQGIVFNVDSLLTVSVHVKRCDYLRTANCLTPQLTKCFAFRQSQLSPPYLYHSFWYI